MDLGRTKNPEKLALCKKYYQVGFVFLPFIWLVNSVWFFNEAFRKPVYDEQPMIKTYVIRSMVGLCTWIAALTAWITVYQLKRVEWGAIGENLSFILPLGKA